MNGIKLALKDSPSGRVDARAISRVGSGAKTGPEGLRCEVDDFRQRVLRTTCGEAILVGEVFDVSGFEAESPVLHLVGDLANFDMLGYRHRLGVFCVDGNVGNQFVAELRGGEVFVGGESGDQIGGASGASNRGMSGGRVEISGDAGQYCGARMRRGEIFVNGSVGDFAGASMIAGTIGVGKSIGGHAGFGMRRGTIAVTELGDRDQVRLTDPVLIRSLYPRLVDFSGSGPNNSARCEGGSDVGLACQTWSECLVPRVASLYQRLGSGLIASRRGDLSVGGMGEILTPE